MKNVLLSIVATLAICSFMACSNGDYNTNVNGSANNSHNPLVSLDSAGFNWTGTDPLSMKINGVSYVGDSATTLYSFSAGFNSIISISGIQEFLCTFKDAYTNNIYNMGYNQYNDYGLWADTATSATAQYFSYKGNSGQVQVLRNDATRFIGKFYFQGVNSNGAVLNVSEGWFNIHK